MSRKNAKNFDVSLRALYYELPAEVCNLMTKAAHLTRLRDLSIDKMNWEETVNAAVQDLMATAEECSIAIDRWEEFLHRA